MANTARKEFGPVGANPLRQDDYTCHFNTVDVTNEWTKTVDASCTVAQGVTGESTAVYVINTAAGSEAQMATKRKWIPALGRPLLVQVRFSVQEANTNMLNLFIGFNSGGTTDITVDAGAGMIASFSGAGIYKVGGTSAVGSVLNWRTVSSVATTRYGDRTTGTPAGYANYQIFEMEIHPISSTQAEVIYRVDQEGGNSTRLPYLRDSSQTGPMANMPIQDLITYTSWAATPLMVDVKAGSTATNAEGLLLDYVRVSQILA